MIFTPSKAVRESSLIDSPRSYIHTPFSSVSMVLATQTLISSTSLSITSKKDTRSSKQSSSAAASRNTLSSLFQLYARRWPTRSVIVRKGSGKNSGISSKRSKTSMKSYRRSTGSPSIKPSFQMSAGSKKRHIGPSSIS